MAGFGIDLDLDAAAGDHPERRRVRGQARAIRRDIIRLVGAGADDIAGLHAIFLPEQIGERGIAAFRLAQFGPQRRDLGARLLGGEPHGVAHVEQRARTERAHVIGRDIGIARHDAHRLGRHVEHFADHLRHRGVGALPHIDGAAIKRGAAIGRDIDDRHRRRGRDHRLDRDRKAAAAAYHAGAAVERLFPVEPLGDAIEHLLDRGVLQDRAGRMRAAVAQQILLAEFERIALERARDHVGVAFIGPHQLRERRSRARRRPASGWYRARRNRSRHCRCRKGPTR